MATEGTVWSLNALCMATEGTVWSLNALCMATEGTVWSLNNAYERPCLWAQMWLLRQRS